MSPVTPVEEKMEMELSKPTSKIKVPTIIIEDEKMEEVTSCGKLKVIPSTEPLFTRKLDVLEVIEGRNARFDCKVSGTPSPKVTWSHFDHPLTESEDIRILQEGGRHSLIISHVTNDDEGFYTVIARNSHGEAESSAELYIQEPRPHRGQEDDTV
uniref:Ig-like domain-containing protein n=1 Tax=Seriola dumerili TaxID=41447 RepID=A0A3B4U203_SERDU